MIDRAFFKLIESLNRNIQDTNVLLRDLTSNLNIILKGVLVEDIFESSKILKQKKLEQSKTK